MIVILHRYLQGFKHGFSVRHILQTNVTLFKIFTHSFAMGFSFAQFGYKSFYHHKVDVTMIVDLCISWQI